MLQQDTHVPVTKFFLRIRPVATDLSHDAAVASSASHPQSAVARLRTAGPVLPFVPKRTSLRRKSQLTRFRLDQDTATSTYLRVTFGNASVSTLASGVSGVAVDATAVLLTASYIAARRARRELAPFGPERTSLNEMKMVDSPASQTTTSIASRVVQSKFKSTQAQGNERRSAK